MRIRTSAIISSWRRRSDPAGSKPAAASEGASTRSAQAELKARQREEETERRARFGLLLAAIVCAFAVQGIATPGQWEQCIVSVLLAGTLLLAFQVAEVRRQFTRPVAVLAALLVILSFVEAVAGDAGGITVRIANLLLVTLAPPAIVVGTIRTMRARRTVTIEAVLGVLCLYLLAGMFFAFVYGMLGRLHGGFFVQDVPATAAHCLYFSFTTLTTVGYGDLTASSNLGHTLSISEALLGQIYLVTVVSLIVGNLGTSRRRADPTLPR